MEREYLASDDGQVTVYGADLPALLDGDAVAEFEAAAATTVYDTSLAYAAFSNYNFILMAVNGGVLTPLERKATPDAKTNWNVSDNSDKARITFGAQPDVGQKYRLIKVTPATVMAQTDEGVAIERASGRSYDLLWAALAGSTLGATNVYVVPRE